MLVCWWLFEEHYKWEKRKNFLHGVRIQPRFQGFPAPAIFKEECPGDVYEKYFIPA